MNMELINLKFRVQALSLGCILGLFFSTLGDVSNGQLLIEITQGVERPVPMAVVPFAWEGSDTEPPMDLANLITSNLTQSGRFQAILNDNCHVLIYFLSRYSVRLCSLTNFPATNSDIFVHFRHLRDLSFLVVPKFLGTAQYNSRTAESPIFFWATLRS